MNWRLIIGIGLALVAAISGWSAWRNRNINAAGAEDLGRADFVMHDFEMTALDKQGKESVTLRAPSMQRDPKAQTYAIATPLFLMPDAQGKYWEMRANTGWISAKGEELRLDGDVVGTSPAGAATPSRFETTRLNVFPNEQRAVTDQQVTLTQPGTILTGRGFETNLKTRQYEIKSQVKSRYVPKSAR